ncbi:MULTISPECIES: ferritin-like domain-containing protein [unclassified Mucilaginibacter]|uniref:ferritin-like domain-containing protein n=1 Tax=unclassified Mucilaginibacter TaxID=2617802 RepID=UPI002AC997BF|nr:MULTISPECIES: ferritin-like domain-containing protein [unclassified Mucilaginibacter]MEB0263996.1 ferritin-like domain-containing protein [Mucilaginibacter sp. 10I4]MEB0280166.1 ferritin-like domain-containing protein [Mucilaginibacter sp. 10B2]MEB0303113.1 ferritin-like domain-containing protein [Mucilaginibacter sp. 5C4]WPX24425.1 ferritin-like domain-containing protein [Mucilaginibacter sp. 5C4]
MHTSYYWIGYFQANAHQKRVNWNIAPTITQEEIATILQSLQAWQLGETSEGAHLIAASTKYAYRIGDPDYVDAVKLFIKEEQKHGNNLGRYIDKIGQKRVKKDWGDTLFRKVRYWNTSMEIWTLAVIVVESTAQIFYQALKDATQCRLLKDICTDILIDEAPHITFQTERLAIIFEGKSDFSKSWRKVAYKHFFHTTSLLVWHGHKKLFMAGGVTFDMYVKKMLYKYKKTINMITAAPADYQNMIFKYGS